MDIQDASADLHFSNRIFALMLGRTILGQLATKMLGVFLPNEKNTCLGQTKHSKTFHLIQNKTFPNTQQEREYVLEY